MHIYFKNKIYLKSDGFPNSATIGEKYVKKHYPDLHQILIDFSIKYNILTDHFPKVIWRYMNNITETLKCEQCKINNARWSSFLEGYCKCCGIACSNKSDEYKEKRKKTLLKKHGFENSSQVKEFQEKKKQTNLINRGVEYPGQCKIVQEKCKQTNLKKYGVEFPMQNLESFNKQRKSARDMHQYKDTDLHYQASYELDFLDKYYDKLTIENGPTIRYKFDDKNKIYYSDFYLPDLNLIVEIKSDFTYNKGIEYNLEKQRSCIEQGYKYIFIINKDYTEFNEKINLKNV